MIHYKKGNLLESDAEVLVNTVNTVGVMGKGIALQFKNIFPSNTKEYLKAHKAGELKIGKLLVTKDSSLYTGEKTIVNFPTKTNWREPSKYEYVESGLKELREFIINERINTLAIPPLGAGNGGLVWADVRILIEKYLSNLECSVFVYEPTKDISSAMKDQRVKLTPARAMILYVLYGLVKQGEFVSEFSSEKIAYFLQRLGGADVLKLNFKPFYYGPYSGKVKHLIHYLNGSYIFGYDSKDKKPFQEIGIFLELEPEVIGYLQSPGNAEYFDIAERTKSFLDGYFSNYGLELLSTVDYLYQSEGLSSVCSITERMTNWSERKRTFTSDKTFIHKALDKIKELPASASIPKAPTVHE